MKDSNKGIKCSVATFAYERWTEKQIVRQADNSDEDIDKVYGQNLMMEYNVKKCRMFYKWRENGPVQQVLRKTSEEDGALKLGILTVTGIETRRSRVSHVLQFWIDSLDLIPDMKQLP